MRRTLLTMGLLAACLSAAAAARNQAPPQRENPVFRPAESSRLKAEGIDLSLANPAAQADLRAALDSGDAAKIAAAKKKLLRSNQVYRQWFNDPAAARALQNSATASGRRQFEQQWNLLEETLPQPTMASLYHLKLKRLGVGAPASQDPFAASAVAEARSSVIPSSDDLLASQGFIFPSEDDAIAKAILKDFCRQFGCA